MYMKQDLGEFENVILMENKFKNWLSLLLSEAIKTWEG